MKNRTRHYAELKWWFIHKVGYLAGRRRVNLELDRTSYFEATKPRVVINWQNLELTLVVNTLFGILNYECELNLMFARQINFFQLN